MFKENKVKYFDHLIVGDYKAGNYAEVDKDKISIKGGGATTLKLQEISELVTIGVAAGNTPAVATTGNLSPASSLIVGVGFVVTQAPGGGATTLDIGRTSSGDLDEFIDGASCDVLAENGNNYTNGQTAHTGTQRSIAADTLTLTTDADVTGSAMIVRVTVFYFDMTNPTS